MPVVLSAVVVVVEITSTCVQFALDSACRRSIHADGRMPDQPDREALVGAIVIWDIGCNCPESKCIFDEALPGISFENFRR